MFKTFVRPSDTPIENFILGATEYAVNTTFLKFVAELHINSNSELLTFGDNTIP